MSSASIISCILLLVVVQSCQAGTLPDYLKVCHRSDPNIADCIKNTVHSLRPYLGKGISELNAPPMEPLYIGDLNILDGGAQGLHVQAKKLNILGASNFEIKKLKANSELNRFDFELVLPHLQGSGNYEIDGRILTLPIKGQGPFTGNFTNFYAYVKVIFDFDKPEHADLKDLKVKIRTGQGSIHLKNLFNGDKALGDIVNETINQNFELFTNEVIVPIERALEKKFFSIAKQIVTNFTHDELLPE